MPGRQFGGLVCFFSVFKILKLSPLDKEAGAIKDTFGGIRSRHEALKVGLHNTTSHIREMKELSRSKFIRLKGTYPAYFNLIRTNRYTGGSR